MSDRLARDADISAMVTQCFAGQCRQQFLLPVSRHPGYPDDLALAHLQIDILQGRSKRVPGLQ